MKNPLKTTQDIHRGSVARYLRRHVPRKDWGPMVQRLWSRLLKSRDDPWHHVSVAEWNRAVVAVRRKQLGQARYHLKEATKARHRVKLAECNQLQI